MTNPEAPQKSDPNFDKYPDTVLVFDDGLRIDLTREITPADREHLKFWFPGAFAVLTASDPFGTPIPDEKNLANHEALHAALLAVTSDISPVQGQALDGSHSEDGFGCEITLDQAAQIARRFRQSAFFWYDAMEFSLIESEGATTVFRLPKR